MPVQILSPACLPVPPCAHSDRHKKSPSWQSAMKFTAPSALRTTRRPARLTIKARDRIVTPVCHPRREKMGVFWVQISPNFWNPKRENRLVWLGESASVQMRPKNQNFLRMRSACERARPLAFKTFKNQMRIVFAVENNADQNKCCSYFWGW
jgi:hypothetical protein